MRWWSVRIDLPKPLRTACKSVVFVLAPSKRDLCGEAGKTWVILLHLESGFGQTHARPCLTGASPGSLTAIARFSALLHKAKMALDRKEPFGDGHSTTCRILLMSSFPGEFR